MPYLCLIHLDKGVQYKSYDNLNNAHGCNYCGYDKTRGENMWDWKGGISPLTSYLRREIGGWKNNSLKACDFKCVITGEVSHNLVVHHLIGFNTILQKVMKNLRIPIYQEINNYTREELDAIKTALLQEHDKLLGICLKPEIHDLFHKYFGKGSNTPEQFDQFKLNYENGVYFTSKQI